MYVSLSRSILSSSDLDKCPLLAEFFVARFFVEKQVKSQTISINRWCFHVGEPRLRPAQRLHARYRRTWSKLSYRSVDYLQITFMPTSLPAVFISNLSAHFGLSSWSSFCSYHRWSTCKKIYMELIDQYRIYRNDASHRIISKNNCTFDFEQRGRSN